MRKMKEREYKIKIEEAEENWPYKMITYKICSLYPEMEEEGISLQKTYDKLKSRVKNWHKNNGKNYENFTTFAMLIYTVVYHQPEEEEGPCYQTLRLTKELSRLNL